MVLMEGLRRNQRTGTEHARPVNALGVAGVAGGGRSLVGEGEKIADRWRCP